tara:strand:+ start:372 stop:683 length:312 start_codon:yes stop_codon:yes gene_type:complete
MWVTVDFCLIPLGVGVSLSPFVVACQKIIEKASLDYELCASGTSIEGEWHEVFSCIESCHKAVHKLGAKRIYSTVKINTRIDRKQSFREKVPKIESLLASEKN